MKSFFSKIQNFHASYFLQDSEKFLNIYDEIHTADSITCVNFMLCISKIV